MKVLHSADWHTRDKNIEEVEKCLNFLLGKAQEVDLVVIPGDITDSRDLKLDSLSAKLIIKTVSELADLCPVVIVKGTESHDGNSSEILQYVKGKYDVVVATRPMQVKMSGGYLYASNDKNIVDPDAIITLVPQPTKQFFNNGSITESNESISQAMNGLFAGFGAQAAAYPNAPHVLAGHWNVSGARLPAGQTLTGQDIDISTDQMMLAQPDLGCLGHIHSGQKLGDRFFYSGPIYSTKIDEVGPNGFYIHTLEGKTIVSSVYFDTPCKKFVRFTSDFTTMPFNGVAAQASEYPQADGYYYVRHDITCWQDDAVKINKEELRQLYIGGGAIDADIRINAVPRETIRAAAVLEAETLKDEFVEMAKLRGEEIDPVTLSMAEQLETVPAEELLKTIAEAA